MRKLYLIALSLLSVNLCACGTTCTAFDKNCGKLYPYSGTVASAQGHSTQLDVPFSIVADTLLLPYAIPKVIVESINQKDSTTQKAEEKDASLTNNDDSKTGTIKNK